MAKKKATLTHSDTTRIDLAAKTRSASIQILSRQLVDTFDLYSQVKMAHWNIKGREFYALHQLFDDLASALLPQIDDIAERIVALGGSARASVRQAAQASRLAEIPEPGTDARAIIASLADRYATLARSTRAAIDACDEIDDDGSEDLLTGISRDLDKKLWFLEAHLQD
jgi:starvation-inducible DNA-binding protein